MAEDAAALPQGQLLGYADRIDWHGAAGWAFDPDHPDTAVELEIVDNDAVIGRITADRLREGLAQAGIGDGRHSFDVRFDPPLSHEIRHVVRVRRAGTGVELKQSRVVLEPSPPRVPADPIRCHIDHPAAAGGRAELAGSANLFVEGWAIAEHGVARIEIKLDGATIGETTHGLPRQGRPRRIPRPRERVALGLHAFEAALKGGPQGETVKTE